MRYFFHVLDEDIDEDPDGVDFPNDDAAMRDAARAAVQMAEELLHGGKLSLAVHQGTRLVGVVSLTVNVEVVAQRNAVAS